MADWPRAIKPEDRIKYLVEAREQFRESVNWMMGGGEFDGEVMAVTEREEKLWVERDNGVFRAMYASNSTPEFLVGEFDRSYDARKALTDHVVVIWAVTQAWEDVAS